MSMRYFEVFVKYEGRHPLIFGGFPVLTTRFWGCCLEKFSGLGVPPLPA